MALEWISRWHEKRRRLKACQVGSVLQYPGSDIVRVSAAGDCIGQKLLSEQFNRSPIMWHTNNGDRTLEGAEASLFALTLWDFLCELEVEDGDFDAGLNRSQDR